VKPYHDAPTVFPENHGPCEARLERLHSRVMGVTLAARSVLHAIDHRAEPFGQRRYDKAVAALRDALDRLDSQ
jgi:hypothetical protein